MADVIICVGAVFSKQKTVEMMRLRVEKCAQLYKEGKAKKIIFTGGFKTKKSVSEARFMAQRVIKLGVPKKDIILDEKSNNSIGHAHYCNIIMDKKGFKSCIVVTSPFHLKRIKYIFTNIIKNKKIEFETCKNNLNLFEKIFFYADEIRKLRNLKKKGIYAFGT